MMRRRPHKKSRAGCIVCKKRHVKCDEARPTCVQCATSKLRCEYNKLQSNETRSSPSQNSPAQNISSHPSPQLPVVGSSIDRLDATHVRDPFEVNMLHLNLMHHFSEAFKDFHFHPSKFQDGLNLILKAAQSAPYLMYELLAISALHLSLLRPDQREYFHHQASGLQTRALSLFGRPLQDINASNCVSVVLFSWLIAIYSLCEVVEYQDPTSGTFLDSYINSLDLRRGTRHVTASSWGLIIETELQPVLRMGHDFVNSSGEKGTECDRLSELLNSAEMSQTAKTACQAAIDHLQKVFDSELRLGGHPYAFMIWPIMLDSDFMDLLMRRTPEALVVVTFYAVLLHRQRKFWFIGNGGRYLLDAIDRHLGAYWASWLAWPKSIVYESTASEATVVS